jgi:hypothetical protein
MCVMIPLLNQHVSCQGWLCGPQFSGRFSWQVYLHLHCIRSR